MVVKGTCKAVCAFCSKEKGGFCTAKGAHVEIHKARRCSKYVEDAERVEKAEKKHKINLDATPMYKPTFRYYERLLSGKTSTVEAGPDYVKVR